MTKKTLCVLLVAVFLMLIGAVLFLFPFFTQSTDITPTIYEIHSPLQQIEIDFNKTDLTVCSDEKTFIEIIGYRENEYYVSEEDGKLLLTDRFEKSPILFKIIGIGRYFQERKQVSESQKIILHLSTTDSQTPVNLILKNSTLSLAARIDYLTLNADNSNILVDHMEFDRFNGKLTNCDSSFSLAYSDQDFSRDIETHATKLSINGDERANTEQYIADFHKPYFKLEAQGGSCRLSYSDQTP